MFIWVNCTRTIQYIFLFLEKRYLKKLNTYLNLLLMLSNVFQTTNAAQIDPDNPKN